MLGVMAFDVFAVDCPAHVPEVVDLRIKTPNNDNDAQHLADGLSSLQATTTSMPTTNTPTTTKTAEIHRNSAVFLDSS